MSNEIWWSYSFRSDSKSNWRSFLLSQGNFLFLAWWCLQKLFWCRDAKRILTEYGPWTSLLLFGSITCPIVISLLRLFLLYSETRYIWSCSYFTVVRFVFSSRLSHFILLHLHGKVHLFKHYSNVLGPVFFNVEFLIVWVSFLKYFWILTWGSSNLRSFILKNSFNSHICGKINRQLSILIFNWFWLTCKR